MGFIPFTGAVTFQNGATVQGGDLVVKRSSAHSLVVSSDGGITTNGSFVVDETAVNSQTACPYFAIFNSSTSLWYGIGTNIPSPAGTAIIGGYYNGLGVGGSSNATGNALFGVLTSTQTGNGIGSAAMTVYDNNTIQSFNNVLDDGAGNVTAAGNIATSAAGKGLRVKEGSNAKQGTAVLTAGSVVVANTSVTATSRILVTSNADGGTPGWLRVSARTAATSFTITSSSGTDTSTVAWEMFEPG